MLFEMKIKLRSLKGFTLMEMIVVIVIVGLLATIMTVTYVGVKATARDTQRFDDISTIIQAVDSFVAYNNVVYQLIELKQRNCKLILLPDSLN